MLSLIHQPMLSVGFVRLLSFTLGSEGEIVALCIPAGGSREPTTVESLSRGRQYLGMDGRTVLAALVVNIETLI